MKNYKKLFAWSMIALMGLSLTACSDDDLDTNPYNKSGVNIVAFGPSPILRTNEIRITGTNLNQVTAVAFPGQGATVERAAFNNSDAKNIYVNVPDASVPGKIRLMVGNDTVATSTSLITFEEPIEITSVSPTTGLSAGDEVTVKGEYVYNIAEAIFTSGVTGAAVAAEDFTYVSRREIRLRVPLAAESGVLTMNDGADWEYEYKTPLQVNTATVTSVSPVNTDFNQQIQIFGTNLQTVESIMFPGGVSADFTVSADNKTITTTVPAETKSGAVTLVLFSGAALTTEEIIVPEISVESVNPADDLRVGDVVTVTGQNFDRITAFTLPGYGTMSAGEYSISGNTLTFTVPEGMSDGKATLTQNSFISVTFNLVMHSDAAETAIWTGSFECDGWAGNQDLAWGGFDWSSLEAGTQLRFYYKKIKAGQWGCISLRHGDNWANLPDPIPGQYDLDEDEGVLVVTLPQNVLDDLIANGGLVITGDNFILTKVAIPATEIVLWEGEAVADNWSDQPYLLSDAGAELVAAGAQAGQTIYFYLTPLEADWKLEIVEGHWGDAYASICNVGNPDTENGKFAEYDLDGNSGRYGLKLTQEILDAALTQKGWGGVFVLNGDNLICTKLTLE